MALLGPAPGDSQQLSTGEEGQQEQEENSSGLFNYLIYGAIGFVIYKAMTGTSEEELEGT